jgi:hypothetical protein
MDSFNISTFFERHFVFLPILAEKCLNRLLYPSTVHVSANKIDESFPVSANSNLYLAAVRIKFLYFFAETANPI